MRSSLVSKFEENVPGVHERRPDREPTRTDGPEMGEGARPRWDEFAAIAEFEKFAGGISEHRGLLLDTRRGLTRNSDKNPSGHLEIDD